METKSLLEAMKASISEVLETMFFLPIDRTEIVETETFHRALDGYSELVEVKFFGALSGSFFLLIPDELALFLTASFLGSIEEQVLPEHIGETKKEIINMIAGNTLSNFNDQVVFDLGIPEFVSPAGVTKGSGTAEEVIYQSNTLEKCLFVRVLLDRS